MASSRASIRAIAAPTASFCKQWCHYTAPCRRPEYIGCFHPTTPTVTEDKKGFERNANAAGFFIRLDVENDSARPRPSGVFPGHQAHTSRGTKRPYYLSRVS
jgi:hypothetical protein